MIGEANNASGQPTPEQSGEAIRNFKAAAPDADAQMQQIIHDAEAGGQGHMDAVLDALASLPPAPPDPKASQYDRETGRPAFHETNILLELRMRINGRLFIAREAIDPYTFEMRLGDGPEFEKFVGYFIRSSCGRMATDPEAYRYFRDQVWIVHPGDRHDSKRCADGWSASPRCDLGLITKAPLVVSWMPDTTIEPPSLRTDTLGVCPCRCHRDDGSGARSGSLGRMYGLPGFDEAMLDENGDPR